MSLILNIETSIDVCSVALFNGLELMDFRENKEGKSHASLLTVFIEDLLKTNKVTVSQLSAVAVSMGPGSYTGLRIGVSTAKGLCYGASIPLISINTLQIVTQAFLKNHTKIKEQISSDSVLCPMIDARRQEVYTALYDANGNEISGTQAVIINEHSFSDVLINKKIYFFGNGAEKCSGLIKHPNAVFIGNIYPSALDMAEYSLALFNRKEFQDIAYFEPYYLKDFVATIPKNKILPLG
jgi:tRNA threonylcarbamoyladenosine biosynthesis protein TsaB